MSRTTLSSIFLMLQILVFAKSNPEVELPDLGKIQGSFEKSLNGRTINSFEGIPYAVPPIGQHRFQEPQEIKPWKGIWEAKTIYRCMQYYEYTPPGQDYVIGDEDCLYVNIYTPTLNQDANLDVIVYIHGGSFMFNYGGLYRPDYILDKDVIFVTLNYRLGPLGFLSTENEIVPGNNGMKDQIFALQFIKKHIRYFGGNNNSITICGTSAGGVSVHFHYLSLKSRNLFQRGMSQSGTTMVPWALMENPLGKTHKLAAAVGCSSDDINEIIDCLKSRPAKQIVSTVKKFQPWLYLPFSPFGIVVDKWSSDPVLPEHPYVLLKNKQVYDVPWIVSYTNSEGLYPSEEFYPNHLDDVADRWNELIPLILDYNYTVDTSLHDEVSQKIRNHYLGEARLNKSTFKDFISILSERLFVNDIQKAARLHAWAVTSPVYAYQFAYRGKNSWFQYRSEDGRDFGAAHADDTPYLFRLRAMDTTTTNEDKQMVKFFVDMIATYAQTGTPTVAVDWSPLSKDLNQSYSYLDVRSSTKLSMELAASNNTEFWSSLPIRENEKLSSAVNKKL